MLAIIEAQGKQYLVKEGKKITTNRIRNQKVGDIIVFDKVLLTSNSGQAPKIGKPYIAGVKVEGKITR